MNHQPFEKLILQDEPLLNTEQEQLSDHLNDCDSCRMLSLSWKAVDWQLQQSELAAPADGFADRWMVRLDKDRKRAFKRQGIFFLGLSLGAALFLTLGIIMVSIPIFQSPQLLFWAYVDRLLSLFTLMDYLRDLGFSIYLSFGQQLSGSSSWLSSLPMLLIFAAGAAFELLVLWYLVMRKITSTRQVID